jgi:hypothetical protein
MQNHFLNLIAIYIAIITKRGITKSIHSFGYSSKEVGKKPGFHGYIICRLKMSEGEFLEYLKQNYEWWFKDSEFFDYFKKQGRIEEILQMQKMYANPEIELEIKLSEIVKFLITHLDCTTAEKKLLLYLQILSSKCFYFNRKSLGKNWSHNTHNKKKTVVLHDCLKIYRHEIKIQSFFFKLLVDLIDNQPNLKKKIEYFSQNESRMWDAIFVGFNLMSKLFLYRDIPASIVCKENQKQLCESTSTLCYAFAKNRLEEYKIFKNFYPTQNTPPKFRHFLISRSNFGLILVWRLFHRDDLNKLKKNTKFICCKNWDDYWFFTDVF